MAIRDKLNAILSQVTGDNADAIKTIVNEAVAELDTFEASKRKADNEAASRKQDLKEANDLIDRQKAELEKLQTTNPDTDGLKKKADAYDALLKKQNDEVIAKWTDVSKNLTVDKAHKNFDKIEKVKGRFVNLEGKDLTPEQASKNLDVYNLLTDTGFFEIEKKPDTPPDKSRAPGANSGAPTTSGQALFTNQIK